MGKAPHSSLASVHAPKDGAKKKEGEKPGNCLTATPFEIFHITVYLRNFSRSCLGLNLRPFGCQAYGLSVSYSWT